MTRMMNIARFQNVERGFAIEQAPVPGVGRQDVLVRVSCCAVSATDIYRYRNFDNPVVPPFAAGETPGHEIAGTVVEIGSGVTAVGVGDRVVVQPVWGCGTCGACRSGKENFCAAVKAFGFHVPGGFAEFISARQDIVLGLGARTTFEAAVQTHHLAVNLYGLTSAGIVPGAERSAAVFGTGNLGLLMVMLLDAWGLKPVFAVDILPSRLALAAELSGCIAVDAGKADPAEVILHETGGAGVDVAVELAGGAAPTVSPAIKTLKKGGALIAIAVKAASERLDYRAILSKSLRVQGSATHTMREMQAALELIQSGRVRAGRLVSHHFPLEDINRAFDCRLDDPEALYVVVDIQGPVER